MENVRVNKGLLAALVAVAAVSLLAVAFLLGRGSGAVPPAGRTAQDETSHPPAPDTLPPPQPVVAAASVYTSLSDLPREAPAPATVTFPGGDHDRSPRPPAAEPAPAPTPVTAGDSAPTSDPTAAAVGKYLAEVDRIQAGNINGSPENVAGEMASALAGGDTSGLDKMIRDTEAAKERLAALTPPAACVAHRTESLTSLGDAADVLRSLKDAMASPDPAAALAAVASKATALQARAETLQKEDRALRQRYGLTR